RTGTSGNDAEHPRAKRAAAVVLPKAGEDSAPCLFDDLRRVAGRDPQPRIPDHRRMLAAHQLQKGAFVSRQQIPDEARIMVLPRLWPTRGRRWAQQLRQEGRAATELGARRQIAQEAFAVPIGESEGGEVDGECAVRQPLNHAQNLFDPWPHEGSLEAHQRSAALTWFGLDSQHLPVPMARVVPRRTARNYWNEARV